MKDENKISKKKFNVIILGEGKVGKTSIIMRVIGKQFQESTLSTAGIDYFTHEKEIDGVKYKFKIFDTAGQERYRSISSSTIKLADGFIVVFALNDKTSFSQVKYWISQIEDQADITIKPLIIVGNKSDLQREVTNEEGLNYANSINLKYYETSAKTGQNIEEVFDALFNEIYKQKNKREKGVQIRRKNTNEEIKGKKCCK